MNKLLLYNLYSILVFSTIYFILSHSDTDEHFKGLNKNSSMIDVFYFSVSVQSTVGFGDVYPKSKTAKLIVSLQQIFIIIGFINN